MSFELLRNRKIIDILIGDHKVTDEYSLPYLSGSKLCELCTTFGLTRVYSWAKGAYNMSRWQYIANMRNVGSDAHGVGSKRINIKEPEARLMAYSAMVIAEYVLCKYEEKGE